MNKVNEKMERELNNSLDDMNYYRQEIKQYDLLSDERKQLVDEMKANSANFNGITRGYATQGQNASTQLGVIKTLSQDPKERAEYVKATMPQYCPTKLLK